jgi:cytochrome P450
VIGRHDPVLEALRDHKSFSTRSVFMPARPWPPEVQAILDTGYSQHYLSNNDPPEYTPLRKAVQKAFTRTQTTAMAGGVTEIAEELVDEFAADGSVHIERLCIHSRRAWSPACSACRSRTSRSSKHGATTG